MAAFSLVALVTIAGGFYVKTGESFGRRAAWSQLEPPWHRSIYLPDIKEDRIAGRRERNEECHQMLIWDLCSRKKAWTHRLVLLSPSPHHQITAGGVPPVWLSRGRAVTGPPSPLMSHAKVPYEVPVIVLCILSDSIFSAEVGSYNCGEWCCQ